jgi:hypothetical protein
MLLKEENIEKLIENIEIETEYLTLSAYDKIEPFLKTDSKVQLHQALRYYFVTEEVWPVLQEQIFKDYTNIEKKDFFKILEDYTKIQSFYQKKMLVFEAS